jgi:hypothetical protein
VGLAVLLAVAVLSSGYHARVQAIPAPMRAQMTGVSWHRSCPVGLSDLRLITLTYRGFDGRDHTGRLVANRDAAPALVAVFGRLYAARFPIRRMQPVDRYGGDDYRSIEADNTSASTAARQPARRAGRTTPTAGRSTSTRSRTPT